jgi:glycosyltransferase involved in cell wall biosynthesis
MEERVAFASNTTRSAARRALGLHSEEPLVVYTGKIYPGMAELSYLLEAAAHLSECQFILTGGQPAAIRAIQTDLERRRLVNVTLAGFLEKAEATRYYQQAATVLVSYYSVRDHSHAHHNLPNKLAEYMSTGNPAVVADFRAVRDIATPDTALLVEPDKPAALIDAISRVVSQPAAFYERAQRARALMRERTFERVAAELVHFLCQA